MFLNILTKLWRSGPTERLVTAQGVAFAEREGRQRGRARVDARVVGAAGVELANSLRESGVRHVAERRRRVGGASFDAERDGGVDLRDASRVTRSPRRPRNIHVVAAAGPQSIIEDGRPPDVAATSPRNIHVGAAAAPRRVPTECSRRTRGGAASIIEDGRPSPRNIHVGAAAAPRRVPAEYARRTRGGAASIILAFARAATTHGWQKRSASRSFAIECPTRIVRSQQICRRARCAWSRVNETRSKSASRMPCTRVTASAIGSDGATSVSRTTSACAPSGRAARSHASCDDASTSET